MAAEGFAVLNAKTKQHVIEIAKEFLALAGDGESEIIPLLGGPPQA